MAELLNFFSYVRVLFCAKPKNFQLTWVASGNDSSHPAYRVMKAAGDKFRIAQLSTVPFGLSGSGEV
jgi:hypothetical protein